MGIDGSRKVESNCRPADRQTDATSSQTVRIHDHSPSELTETSDFRPILFLSESPVRCLVRFLQSVLRRTLIADKVSLSFHGALHRQSQLCLWYADHDNLLRLPVFPVQWSAQIVIVVQLVEPIRIECETPHELVYG